MNIIKAKKGENYTLTFKEDSEGYYSFECPITKTKFIISFNSEKELTKKYSLISDGDPEVEISAFVFKTEGDIHLSYNLGYVDLGILHHETVHLVHLLFQIIGQNPDKFNDELQAYYSQFIFTTIKEIIEEYFRNV